MNNNNNIEGQSQENSDNLTNSALEMNKRTEDKSSEIRSLILEYLDLIEDDSSSSFKRSEILKRLLAIEDKKTIDSPPTVGVRKENTTPEKPHDFFDLKTVLFT